MHATLKNQSPKLLWLRLNSGEYVSIPARGSRSVDKARLERNAAYDKLCKRGVLAVVEKKQAKKAPEDKEEPAKAKTKETEEDDKKAAAIDMRESTLEEARKKRARTAKKRARTAK